VPTLTQLPSGKWRAQVRKLGFYKNQTFDKKRDAQDWANAIEAEFTQGVNNGYRPIPKEATVENLINKYRKEVKQDYGRTKAATLDMLVRELGDIKLTRLSPLHLQDFIDRRLEQGAGGVTIAADLSFLSAILKWARHSRRLSINDRMALEARASIKHRGIKTRSKERDREPTPAELDRLYAFWRASNSSVPMEDIARFALATGMRLNEICSIAIEDIDTAIPAVWIRNRKDPKEKQGNDQQVPLLPDAWALAQKHMGSRQAGKVFDYNAGTCSTYFTRACTAVGIEDLHFHDLRHAATAALFRIGLDIPRVALMTGHKTWAMLARYTKIKPEDILEKLKEKEREKKD